MKIRFKPHLAKITRKRTSIDRDMNNGLCLDRNERVSCFSHDIIEDIYRQIPKYTFNMYPNPDGLYKKIARWLNVPKQRIYITNGITEGIRIVFETLVSPGDKVVLVSPAFPMYRIYSEIYQAKVRNIGFCDDLSFDVKGLYDAIDSETHLVCLPNPNLPIETNFKLDDIRRLAERCRKCQAMLVVDEAYCFFGSESAMPLVEEYDNIVVFQTFSKAFGLAGVRLGYMVSKEENIEYLSKTRSLVESNGISMAIAEYILEHPTLMQEYSKDVTEGAKYLKKELDRLGFRWFGGDVTNGLLIFLRDRAETNELIGALKSEKIYIRGSFEPPIDNCVRLTLGPKEEMKKFINAFAELAKNFSVRKNNKTKEVI